MDRFRPASLITIAVFSAALLALRAAPLPASGTTPAAHEGNADQVYGSLWLYQGTWELRMSPDSAPQTIQNRCSRIEKYFACQQTVGGQLSSLIVFIPAEEKGHYFTQTVLPQGFAGGRGELTIEGEHWEYNSKGEENGKTTFYRTTNAFSGRDKIHFEQAVSPDGDHWSIKSSGDEIRIRTPK